MDSSNNNFISNLFENQEELDNYRNETTISILEAKENILTNIRFQLENFIFSDDNTNYIKEFLKIIYVNLSNDSDEEVEINIEDFKVGVKLSKLIMSFLIEVNTLISSEFGFEIKDDMENKSINELYFLNNFLYNLLVLKARVFFVSVYSRYLVLNEKEFITKISVENDKKQFGKSLKTIIGKEKSNLVYNFINYFAEDTDRFNELFYQNEVFLNCIHDSIKEDSSLSLMLDSIEETLNIQDSSFLLAINEKLIKNPSQFVLFLENIKINYLTYLNVYKD